MTDLPDLAELLALDLTEDERRSLAYKADLYAHDEEDYRWQPHPEPARRGERAARWRQIRDALHPSISGYPNRHPQNSNDEGGTDRLV